MLRHIACGKRTVYTCGSSPDTTSFYIFLSDMKLVLTIFWVALSAVYDATVFNYSLPACVNDSHYCMGLCDVCHGYFNGNMMVCLSNLLESLCLSKFHSDMAQTNGDWCIWGNVSGFYSNLSICTEEISDCLIIPWPNPLVEQTFLDIHVQYFQDCPSEELSDPPPGIVFALVITPICLIPVMVSLVVLKTKNGDGSQ